MVQNKEGFLEPKIDFDRCIDCGICRKICPVANKPLDSRKAPQTLALINKNDEVRNNSSSGGIFTLLAEHIIDQNGVVFGAAFDENQGVIHKKCETKEEIKMLRGSKYLQSSVSNAYIEAKAELEKGRAVLFTGTPCQIGGLYAYLKKDYDNLYTQDLVCHGVPSPKVWDKYLHFKEKTANSSVSKISFRDKRSGWKKYSVSFGFSNNTEYSQMLFNDLYMRAFLANISLRTSCSECSFKQIHRQSDVTLADFWGVEKINPEINDDKGISLVLIHSQKGKKLIEEISRNVKSFDADFQTAIKENTSYNNSAKPSKFRKSFFDDIDKKPFDKAVNRYLGSGVLPKIRRVFSNFF